MRFSKTVAAGVLLVALSSLASRANARAIDPQAVAVARSKLVAKCTIAEAGCVDGSSATYDVWNKRALPKLGEDGDALADSGEATSSAAGPTTGPATESGATAEVGGLNGDETSDSETSDSDTGGVPLDAGAPSSDDGSADTTSSEGSESTSDDQFPQGPANQPVVDIVARGYGSNGVTDPNGKIQVTINAPGSSAPLDTLEVDLTANSVGVKMAINEVDTIENNPNKVPLRTIIADTWNAYGVQANEKQMSDLTSVNYQTVINDNMVNAFPQAYEAAGQTFVQGARTPLTAAAGTPAYNALTSTIFFNGAQKMLAETAGLQGRTINSIDLFPTANIDVQFNF